MRNCPAESRLEWSVRPQRSPEEYAPGCSQWSPKFLFAGISCEGDLHTSLRSEKLALSNVVALLFMTSPMPARKADACRLILFFPTARDRLPRFSGGTGIGRTPNSAIAQNS